MKARSSTIVLGWAWAGIIGGLGLVLLLAVILPPDFPGRELRYAVCVVDDANPRPCPPDGGEAVVARWGYSWYVAVFDHEEGGWWIETRGMWYHTAADEWLWPHDVQRWACEMDRFENLERRHVPC